MKIAIIGGGPGGYETAIRAAQFGAEVTLIEKNKLGGTCLNVGCIPTKALLHSADLYHEVKNDAAKNGVIVSDVSFDFEKMQERKAMVVNSLVGGVGGLMKAYKINVIEGVAEFKSPTELIAKTPEWDLNVEFDKVIIASGSIPSVVPLPGHDLEGVVDSTGALAFDKVPESLAIIGGGVIGVEMAHVYSRLGTKVTIIEMLPDLLINLDKDIVAVEKKALKKAKVDILTETKVGSIEKVEGGLKVNMTDKNDAAKEVVAEKVLMCVGRRPATAELNLEAAGINNERGRILVDEEFKTNVDNIYAIGDCIGGIMLAHTASAEGMMAIEGIMGKKSEIALNVVPSCVYTTPELSGVGMTEKEAMDKGIDYQVGKFPLIANGKSLIIGEQSGLVKIIAEKSTGTVIGVHMAGSSATELITEGALAVANKLTVENLLSTIHAHPTVGESMKEAAHAVFGNAINMPPMR